MKIVFFWRFDHILDILNNLSVAKNKTSTITVLFADTIMLVIHFISFISGASLWSDLLGVFKNYRQRLLANALTSNIYSTLIITTAPVGKREGGRRGGRNGRLCRNVEEEEEEL